MRATDRPDGIGEAAYTGATRAPILVRAHDALEVVQVVLMLTDGGVRSWRPAWPARTRGAGATRCRPTCLRV